MTGLLISRPAWERLGPGITETVAGAGGHVEPVLLPLDAGDRLGAEERDRAEIAFFSGDLVPDGSRGFFAAAQGSAHLRWMHVFHAGVDNAVFQRLLEKGVRLSTSSGSTAQPIAQTAITGMLMLARGFPHWLEAQRRRSWEPVNAPAALPEDLDRQTIVVVGLGAIGSEIARLAQALGMHVVGVRRSPRKAGDPVDELVPPGDLASVLPRADWLALATPLTAETRRIIDAERLALMPRGARILNIARGEVVDEEAMIAALRAGDLGGAYLDVFEEEPLPAESPLWEMANVIVTPHNASISRRNEARVEQYLLHNLGAWFRREPLVNEVRRPTGG